jgi:serine/threonine protein phosphatase 1
VTRAFGHVALVHPVSARTFAIGDIHGDLGALETLLGRLPEFGQDDTVVFLGDYVDRGPDSKAVVSRVRELERTCVAKVVALRGNHEDLWVECFTQPNMGFLLPRPNGCAETFRSFTGGPVLREGDEPSTEELARLFDVASWFPNDVVEWMGALPTWFENDHAIFVHAGLDGEGTEWKHPSAGRAKPLMWMREPDFYQGYHGKRVVFGHTKVTDLPLDHLGRIARIFDDPRDVWTRADLVGIDTGCGKGGFLSAIELPAMRVYESR